MTDERRKAIQETMRVVLRQATLRAIVKPLGRTPIEVSRAEAAMLLEPYEESIENDFAVLCEAADQLVALSERDPAVAEQAEPFMELRLSTDDENPGS